MSAQNSLIICAKRFIRDCKTKKRTFKLLLFFQTYNTPPNARAAAEENSAADASTTPSVEVPERNAWDTDEELVPKFGNGKTLVQKLVLHRRQLYNANLLPPQLASVQARSSKKLHKPLFRTNRKTLYYFNNKRQAIINFTRTCETSMSLSQLLF